MQLRAYFQEFYSVHKLDDFLAVIQCFALAEIMNGDIEYNANSTSSFVYGTMATYSCREGFFREGVGRRVCRENGGSDNGQWEGTDPVCSRE